MAELLTTLQVIALVIGITSPIALAVIAYIRKRFQSIEALKDDFDDFKNTFDDRQLRHSKAFIIIANRLDDINLDQHGKTLNLGPEIEIILKDKAGEL